MENKPWDVNPALGSLSQTGLGCVDRASWKAEPIAITGLGCRFPGANGPQAFWELLRDKVDAITPIPADRFDIDTFYSDRPSAPGKLISRWGGFLGQASLFDAYFFGISPREAIRMDPQQRLLLEVAWEALEAAGQVPGELVNSRTGPRQTYSVGPAISTP